jgi:soluble epoxide hydrolase / lipid-phosphate phosphatase
VALFHGWPDTATSWAHTVNTFLLPSGYGVVILDCLGYGGSSKPTNPAEYAWDLMTGDIIAIFDAENMTKVISIGHDWGSMLAQRLYNFFPDRVVGLVNLNVAYIPPTGDPFDLDASLESTQKLFGYGNYHYQKFLVAPDAAEILDRHPESVYDAVHGDYR